MPRLKVVDPANAEGRAREIFEGPMKGKHYNIFKGLANSGAGFQGYVGLSSALREADLSATERELIALFVGQTNDCEYCVAAHTAAAKRLGLTEEEIQEARIGKSDEARGAALLAFTAAIHEKRGLVSDEDLEAFRSAGFSDGNVVEVLAAYALSVFTNYFNHVNETLVDFPAALALAH